MNTMAEPLQKFATNSREQHWMPFTGNREFKAEPRIVVRSEGVRMWDHKGGEIIDGSSWSRHASIQDFPSAKRVL